MAMVGARGVSPPNLRIWGVRSPHRWAPNDDRFVLGATPKSLPAGVSGFSSSKGDFILQHSSNRLSQFEPPAASSSHLPPAISHLPPVVPPCRATTGDRVDRHSGATNTTSMGLVLLTSASFGVLWEDGPCVFRPVPLHSDFTNMEVDNLLFVKQSSLLRGHAIHVTM